MVGHTGDLNATIEAISCVDQCIGKLLSATGRMGGTLLITADHGNAEMMLDTDSGQAHTAHTSGPVPLIYVGRHASVTEGGILSDIAPTMLHLIGLPIPPEMSGKILLQPS